MISRSLIADRTGVLFILLSLFWGTSFVAIEAGLAYFPPLVFAGIRYAIAGAILLIYAVYISTRWLPQTPKEWLSVSVSGVLIVGAYHGLLYLGELYVSGAIAAVIVSLTPVLTVLLASVMLPAERLTPIQLGGVLLGLIGVVVIINPDPGMVFDASTIGIVLIFFGALSWAIGSVLIKPLDTTLPLLALISWAMLIGATSLFVGAAIRGETVTAIEWSQTAIISLTYLTVISGVIAFFIYFELHDRVGATQINLVSYLEPVVAIGMSWLLLGSVIDSTVVVGFTAVFAGFALVKYEFISEITTQLARNSIDSL
ncbi:DMT family transporter [Natronocalculus amylovorans]|uniref:DMT family transporter n=1 Tax=Natronocalculus amylovorans TaxID=2917812 RepID=A0AAE3FVU9_9EURY|nr:DMT family transporter [Natronocalculus amylovorans]MCL9816279.1 DMT family transporter [Natronocalculus amylovorans]